MSDLDDAMNERRAMYAGRAAGDMAMRLAFDEAYREELACCKDAARKPRQMVIRIEWKPVEEKQDAAFLG